MSNPAPSITDVEEIHDLIVSHGDKDEHDELYPNCGEWDKETTNE